MQRSYILGAGILFRAVTTTPMERTHGKERNMSQPDTDTAAQSPSSQQEPQIQTDGRRSHSEQMNQPAQTSQSESSHDGKDEHALHTNLKRGMESRHLQMISLGGVIGTGLFLSSGYTIQQAGPIGTILAYSIGALIVYLVMLTLGELSVAMPVTGSFHVYAEKFIGPGTGFVIAIQYWLTWTVALGSEFTAAGLLMQRWFPDSPTWVWSAACIILIFTLNALSVRLFAEAEFWFASIKVFAICAFIVIGSLAIFGVIPVAGYQHAPMFVNLIKDGVFPNGFMPVFATILTVNFAFSGTELIGVTAGETRDPQTAVPKAIHTTLWRLVLFFIGSITVMCALIPWRQAGVGESPFVLVFNSIGIPYAGDIMNFVVLTAVLSASNSGLYASTRMVWSMGNEGHDSALVRQNEPSRRADARLVRRDGRWPAGAPVFRDRRLDCVPGAGGAFRPVRRGGVDRHRLLPDRVPSPLAGVRPFHQRTQIPHARLSVRVLGGVHPVHRIVRIGDFRRGATVRARGRARVHRGLLWGVFPATVGTQAQKGDRGRRPRYALGRARLNT